MGSTVSQVQHALCALARSELEALKTYFGNKDEARSTKQKSNCGNTDEAKAFLLLHMMWCCSCAREILLELLDTPCKGNMSTVKTILTSASTRTIFTVKLEPMAKTPRRSHAKILKMGSAEISEERGCKHTPPSLLASSRPG